MTEPSHEPEKNSASAGGSKLRSMDKATIFKMLGLLAFFGLMIVICVVAWPYISDVFNEGGVERLVKRVQDAGPWGVAVLLGMQFLQIVVAFIPGEVVQIAAGMMYGPLWGAVIILVGCFISSAFIFELVHKLGAPFVQAMVPTTWLDKFHQFQRSGTLDVTVFVLFLIPGLPKDTFTYLIPLTEMRRRSFLLITTLARIPGVLISTFAAAGLADGNMVLSGVLFGLAALLAILAIVFRKQLMTVLDKINK